MATRQQVLYEQAQKFISIQKNCNIITSKPLYRLDNYEYYTCTCTISDSMLINYFNLFDAYKNGILPYIGGYCDQHSLLDDIIQFISAYVHKKENENNAKNKKR